MSAVAPGAVDVLLGLGLDIAWKVSVPLGLGLVASLLPGTAAARHLRLSLALAATPVVAFAVVVARGSDAAWTVGAPAWPLVAWAVGALVVTTDLALGLRALATLPTLPSPAGLERCALVGSPLTAGWWRPRIIVPCDFDTWPREAREAALAHERAHIRRADWLAHVGAWLLGAGLWFHPLAALARRRLAVLAECAADDEVLAEGHDATTYAALLLRVGRPGPAAGLGLGPSVVGIRVRRLLAANPAARSGRGSIGWFVACLVAVVWWTAGAAAWSAPEPTCRPGLEPLPLVDPTPVPWSPAWSSPSSR